MNYINNSNNSNSLTIADEVNKLCKNQSKRSEAIHWALRAINGIHMNTSGLSNHNNNYYHNGNNNNSKNNSKSGIQDINTLTAKGHHESSYLRDTHTSYSSNTQSSPTTNSVHSSSLGSHSIIRKYSSFGYSKFRYLVYIHNIVNV